MCAPPRVRQAVALAATALVLGAGCGTISPAPPGWRRGPAAVQRSPLGSWANVTLASGAIVSGEIIAADADAVYLGAAPRLLTVPGRCVRSMRIGFYETETGGIATWALVGTLSTITHGFFLVMSAPLWIADGVVSTAVAERKGHLTLHFERGGPLASAGTWARFPQGLPSTFAERAPARETVDPSCTTVVPATPPPVVDVAPPVPNAAPAAPATGATPVPAPSPEARP